MKRIALLTLAIVFWARALPSASLYDQSIAEVLRERFTSESLSYLLLDAQTDTLVASRWVNVGRSVPTGSLVKPFTALAYGQSHNYKYPELTCRGTTDGCWLPRGHGHIGIREAIGYSCNAYFRQLAGMVRGEDAEWVMMRYGIIRRRATFSTAAWVGLGAELQIPPEQMARAYSELADRSGEPGVAELLRGMALSARAGTARAIQESLAASPTLAKTGTAPCVHTPRASGDGYVIMLYPADSPRVTLLVRVHGVPGSKAAIVGGEMLRTIVTGR